MSNEVKIGILAVLSIAITIWGLKFMKGQNLLKASNTYYVNYQDVDQLTQSAPILIRGLRVGTVTTVELADDMKTVVATLDVDDNIRIPKNTEALVVSMSIMGGKGIELKFNTPCNGADCAERGSFLNGRVKGMVESMIGTNNLDNYTAKIKRSIGTIAKAAEDSLMAPGADSQIAKGIQNLTSTLNNLEIITAKLANSMDAYDRRVLGIMSNLQSLSGDLAKQTPQISSALTSMNTIAEDIKNADLGGTLKKSGQVMDQANTAMVSLDETLVAAKSSVDQLGNLMTKLNTTDGTLGSMLNDKKLYDEMLLTTTNLQLLLQDFRLNPKRYVNVSVFGKKQKEYAVPEDDPAFEEEK